MAEYKKPTEFMNLTKEELAYKLALMHSFVSEIDSESYLPRFERKYADWWEENKPKPEEPKPEEPKTPVSLKPEEFTEDKMHEIYANCAYLWVKDNHDRDQRSYDLELMFDNIDEGCIDYRKNADYCPCNKTVEEYVAEHYEGKMTVDDFLDKWLAIIRSKKVGNHDGDSLIDFCLDMQDSSEVYQYLGCRDADKYTDEDIREFFRRCWYK